MPNIITHTIFCEEVEKQITNTTYKEMINTYKKEYKIGTNGPDFLFFHGFYPFWKAQDMRIPNIGGQLHRKNINLFYQEAIISYHQQTDPKLKGAMGAYLMGHYLHWQLDSIMHPYVVYKTGFKEPLSKYFHHRFESMIDTIMLDRYRNLTIKNYPTYKNCWQSIYTIDAITAIYQPCIKACLAKAIDRDIIQKALADWELAQRYLYDPKGYKYRLLKVVEACLFKPWLYSGNIVRKKIDTHHDVMNDQHILWLHPCTGAQSKESVTDLFERAKQQSTIGLPLLFAALDDQTNIEPFLSYLDDKTYNNGINEDLPRIYKEVIYKK